MEQLRLESLTVALAIAIAGLAGCTGSIPVTTLGAVGPAHCRSFTGRAPGQLCVLTATEEHNDGDTMFYPHTEYVLYRENGLRLRSVNNHLSARDENPEIVSLPPGRYTVIAESEFDGCVKVPVCIGGGKSTIVNLEGPRGLGKYDSKVDPAHAVTAPSGRIVGWRAES